MNVPRRGKCSPLFDKGGDVMSECKDCHHMPSDRTAEYGATCQCKCHDIADASLQLLAALKAMIATHGIHGPCTRHNCADCQEAYDAAKAAVKKAVKP